MEGAPSGSTPIIFVFGECSLKYNPSPAHNPPPPIGTNTKSTSFISSKISLAIVPCPSITFKCSNGGIKAFLFSKQYFWKFNLV
jgi:hypothetical protein